jgi:hypothetical protein
MLRPRRNQWRRSRRCRNIWRYSSASPSALARNIGSISRFGKPCSTRSRILGDAIYADTDGTTAWAVSEQQLQGEWNRLADKPEFQRFRREIPIMATWDNHDYGTHNGGSEFELKDVSKRIFLDFFAEPEDSDRRNRAGIYDSKVFGPQGQRSA